MITRETPSTCLQQAAVRQNPDPLGRKTLKPLALKPRELSYSLKWFRVGASGFWLFTACVKGIAMKITLKVMK